MTAFPILLTGLLFAGSESVSATPQATDSPATSTRSIEDRPLAPHESKLLELAFRAATALPKNPHVKTRSRVQYEVVEASLLLDQPQRALRYADQIVNWRRGAAYAAYARYCAEHGDPSELEHYLARASAIADDPEATMEQAWRRDRVRVAIAQAYLAAGDATRAAEYATGLTESEIGKVEAYRAAHLEEDTFEAQITGVKAVIATGQFDPVRNALQACARLYDRFYDDKEKRAIARTTIQESWRALPISLRIELMMDLADAAIAHEDHANALAIVEETQPMVEGSRLNAEHRVPLIARLSGVRHAAGDAAGGLEQAKTAFQLFEASTDEIFDIFRPEVIVPIAEAYARMAETELARAAYARAIEEGARNPNTRPRVEDLVATTCSMLRHGIAPDAALLARIRAIEAGLGDPW